jgi:hypothetical protein
LLGLRGFEIEQGEQEADGSLSVQVSTAPGVPERCPGCGTPPGRAKETVGHPGRGSDAETALRLTAP